MDKGNEGKQAGTGESARTGRPSRPGPTIRDVARLASVSIGTVSKALNNSGRLRQETRDRIAEVATEIGFRPNSLAQSLHRAHSFTVGLISNDSFGRFTMPILEGLEATLADKGIAVFMCNATDDPARESQHVEQLLGKRVDGLVFTARRADRRPHVDLGVTGLPVINVFAQSDDSDAFSLLPDDEGGAALATRHLVALGRRRIAHLTGPEGFEAVRLRRAGWSKQLAAGGISVPDDYYLPGVWSEAWARQAVARLFDASGPPPDALFCGNDQVARGAAEALRDRGVAVPQDVAIVGFDNWTVMTDAARPPLTSVDMNLRDLGREAGVRLMEMIGGRRFSGVSRMPCTLVVRESCGGAKRG